VDSEMPHFAKNPLDLSVGISEDGVCFLGKEHGKMSF
jgi:hypothetical protein